MRNMPARAPLQPVRQPTTGRRGRQTRGARECGPSRRHRRPHRPGAREPGRHDRTHRSRVRRGACSRRSRRGPSEQGPARRAQRYGRILDDESWHRQRWPRRCSRIEGRPRPQRLGRRWGREKRGRRATELVRPPSHPRDGAVRASHPASASPARTRGSGRCGSRREGSGSGRHRHGGGTSGGDEKLRRIERVGARLALNALSRGRAGGSGRRPRLRRSEAGADGPWNPCVVVIRDRGGRGSAAPARRSLPGSARSGLIGHGSREMRPRRHYANAGRRDRGRLRGTARRGELREQIGFRAVRKTQCGARRRRGAAAPDQSLPIGMQHRHASPSEPYPLMRAKRMRARG